MFHELKYISTSKAGVFESDFKNKELTVTINTDHIISISTLKKFKTSLTGKYIADYATVRLNNGSLYHIKEKELKRLKKAVLNNK